MAASGYRMENYIGSATISSGDNTLTEANGQNLESLLRQGEVIEVANDAGDDYWKLCDFSTQLYRKHYQDIHIREGKK